MPSRARASGRPKPAGRDDGSPRGPLLQPSAPRSGCSLSLLHALLLPRVRDGAHGKAGLCALSREALAARRQDPRPIPCGSPPRRGRLRPPARLDVLLQPRQSPPRHTFSAPRGHALVGKKPAGGGHPVKRKGHDRGPDPLRLLEEAFHLLRLAPAAIHALYCIGSLPFVLAFLF